MISGVSDTGAINAYNKVREELLMGGVYIWARIPRHPSRSWQINTMFLVFLNLMKFEYWNFWWSAHIYLIWYVHSAYYMCTVYMLSQLAFISILLWNGIAKVARMRCICSNVVWYFPSPVTLSHSLFDMTSWQSTDLLKVATIKICETIISKTFQNYLDSDTFGRFQL